MSFRPEEVSAVLAQELERYEAKLETKSVGTVLSVGDGIARVWGLEDAMAGELIRFPGDVMAMVLNLEEDNVGVVLFGSDKNTKEGDRVALPWLGYACGTCRYCVSGWETLCEKQLNMGYFLDGAYAEYTRAYASYVCKGHCWLIAHKHTRPAFTKGQGLVIAALGLPHHKDEQTTYHEKRNEADENIQPCT